MHGSASIVVPVANCSFAMTLIISVLCGMESVDRYKGAAIAMAGLCVLLLAQAAAQASQASQGGAARRRRAVTVVPARCACRAHDGGNFVICVAVACGRALSGHTVERGATH